MGARRDSSIEFMAHINDKKISVFRPEGGSAVATAAFHTGEDPNTVLQKLCQKEGLTGSYLAIESGLFGSPQRVQPFTAEIVQPPVEITFP